MHRPIVSILLPFHNACETLGETLSSILAQTLEDFEVLAVNDHCNDGSDRLLGRLAERDTRFRVLKPPARGLVSALNFGLAQARSAFVARMDADDRMHPQRLELQYRHLSRNPQIGVLGSRVRIFPEESLTGGLRDYLEWQNGCVSEASIARDIYLEAPLAHPSVMFRKDLIQDYGGYREGQFPEDYDLWLRLFAAGELLAKLPQTLLDWRDSPQRTSRQDPRYSRESFDRLRAHYLAQDPRIEANRDNLAIWGAGRKTRRRVRHLLEKGFKPAAWIDIDPRKIGNRLNGVPVVEPTWLRRSERPFVLSYVAVWGARSCIESELDRLGYRKGENYLNVG